MIAPFAPHFAGRHKHKAQPESKPLPAKPDQADPITTISQAAGEATQAAASKTVASEVKTEDEPFFRPRPLAETPAKPRNALQRFLHKIKLAMTTPVTFQDKQLLELATQLDQDLQTANVATGIPPKVHAFEIRTYGDGTTAYYVIGKTRVEAISALRIPPTELTIKGKTYTIERQNNKQWELNPDDNKWKTPVDIHAYTLKGNGISLVVDCTRGFVEYVDETTGTKIHTTHSAVRSKVRGVMEAYLKFIANYNNFTEKPLPKDAQLRY